MKKVELKGKLSLNKITIAKLNNNQLSYIKGGSDSALEKPGEPIKGVGIICSAGGARSGPGYCHSMSCMD